MHVVENKVNKVADVLVDFKSQRAYKESVPCSSPPRAESCTRRKATRPSFGLGARSLTPLSARLP